MRDLIQGILAWRRRFRELRRQRLVDLLNIVLILFIPLLKVEGYSNKGLGPRPSPPPSLFTPKNKFPTIFKL